MSEAPEGLGTLHLKVEGDPPTAYALTVDRLAAARKDAACYLLSVAGSQGALKGLRAALNAKVRAIYTLEGVTATDGRDSGTARTIRPREGHRYRLHTHPLGYGQVHGLFRTDDPGFLPMGSHETLWKALKSPTYTTPLLRSWVPWLQERLRAEGLLEPLYCYRCECGRLTAAPEDVDRLVEEGVRRGVLPFRELAIIGA